MSSKKNSRKRVKIRAKFTSTPILTSIGVLHVFSDREVKYQGRPPIIIGKLLGGSYCYYAVAFSSCEPYGLHCNFNSCRGLHGNIVACNAAASLHL